MKKEFIFSKFNNLLEGPLLIKPDIFKDERGLFLESWNQEKFNNLIGKKIHFVQDNFSFSDKNVLRGLHYQRDPYSQGKLVRCSQGIIFDVAVDIRKNSSTYGEWGGVTLDSKTHNQFWIPEGFAHGFLVLSDFAGVNYKTTNYYSKEHESSIRWNDPDLAISWVREQNDIRLSLKDRKAPLLSNLLPKELF